MPGDKNNGMIFQQGLAVDLGPRKKVETNKWYLGGLPIDDTDTPERSKMIATVKLGHYATNNWSTGIFCHCTIIPLCHSEVLRLFQCHGFPNQCCI